MIDAFILFARPWWVNVLFLLPVGVFLWFRREKLSLSWKQLLIAALFGVAFGFVEASVVVYLRAALGFLQGYLVSFSEIFSVSADYTQAELLGELPHTLLVVELWREAATMIMLVTIAALSATGLRERVAVFLWAFAFWDLFYYAGLWLTTRWPGALTTPDVLFLIPVPWLSQVWFPYLVSGLTILAIALCIQNRGNSQANGES